MKVFPFGAFGRIKLPTVKRELISLYKAFFCLITASVIFSACSKNNRGDSTQTAQEYYFRATLNSTRKDFRAIKFQGGGNDSRWEHIVVGGYESSLAQDGSALSPSLDFEIWRLGGNIGTGTYATPAEPEMISRYAVQTSNGTLLYNTIHAKDIFTVKIDAISKDGIRGTFAGTLTNGAGESITVKDGAFNLPYDLLVNP